MMVRLDLPLRLAIAGIAGIVGAALVMSATTDFVPDHLELTLALLTLIILTLILIGARLKRDR